jgi:hypothetical protein
MVASDAGGPLQCDCVPEGLKRWPYGKNAAKQILGFESKIPCIFKILTVPLKPFPPSELFAFRLAEIQIFFERIPLRTIGGSRVNALTDTTGEIKATQIKST